MPTSSAGNKLCTLCGQREAALPKDEAVVCSDCHEKSEALFDEEMRRVELIRIVRGRDVELYDVKHPDSEEYRQHCGQVVLIKAGRGFEVKICLRAQALDWMQHLTDDEGFCSADTRLDALIGNVSLLMESWGGGPHYMDIFYVDRVVSTEGEI